MRDGLYIGGRWEKPAAGGTFEVVDPATEQPIAKMAAATAADVDRAVVAAAEALPAWKRTSGAERAAILRAIAAGIRARRDELAAIEVADNGKPLPESEVGHRRCCRLLRFLRRPCRGARWRQERADRARRPALHLKGGASRSASPAPSSRGTTRC
jgi:acyl-CoA reductase-like NAD-dependent aldehyde dehydrogenase